MAKPLVIRASDLQAQHVARMDTLTVEEAVSRVLRGLEHLTAQEAQRLGVATIDWTYHGCDPVWKETLKAASDLAEKALGVKCWGVSRVAHVREYET